MSKQPTPKTAKVPSAQKRRAQKPTTEDAKKFVESIDAGSQSSAPGSDDNDATTSAMSLFNIDASGPSALTNEEIETWVRSSGWTPVEFLTHTYRNPFQKMDHRISAAKAVLEYAHRKLPSKIEVKTSGGVSVASLDAKALAQLSDKELDVLEKILGKIGDVA